MHKQHARDDGGQFPSLAIGDDFSCTIWTFALLALSALIGAFAPLAHARADDASAPDAALAATLEPGAQLTRYAEIPPGRSIGYVVRVPAPGRYAVRVTSISGSGRYDIIVVDAHNQRFCAEQTPEYSAVCIWQTPTPGEFHILIQHRSPLRTVATIWVGHADMAAPGTFD